MKTTPDNLFDRRLPARIGITLLNVLLPGLGLIRIGHRRESTLLAAASLLGQWLISGLAYAAPLGGFAMQGLIYALFLLIYLTLLLLSLVRTWPRTRRDRGSKWWSRWYAIVLIWVIGALSSVGSNAIFRQSYHSFYVASVSMEPTLIRNEKIVADMRWRKAEIGNIVLVRVPGGPPRIYRIAATGGQSFAMRQGVPIIDGQPAIQKQVGVATVSDRKINDDTGRVMLEHLPGENGTHCILQLPGFSLDDIAPVRIPRGAIYLLGDDRDLAADSRVSPDEEGVGILPVSAIIGRPLYFFWSKDHSRIGRRADH